MAQGQASDTPKSAAEALALAVVKIEPELSPQREVLLRVGALFVDEQFDALEAIANEYRDTEERWDFGRWKLTTFYSGLEHGKGIVTPKTKPMPYLQRFDRWIKAYPKSVTARIGLARVRLELAWQSRGGGWASDVSDQGWVGMKRHLEEGWKTLEEAEAIGTADPDLYSQFIQFANALSKSSSEIGTLYEKGIEVNAGYPPLYTSRAWSLMPRWGGRPGELEEFAIKAAEDSSAVPGTGAYVWVANHIRGMTVTTTFVHRFDWSALYLEEGFEDILSVYPDSRWVQNLRARLSGLVGDKQEAQKAFAIIGRDFDTTVWPDKWAYGRWKRWAENDAKWPAGTGIHYGVHWDDPELCRAYLEAGAVIDETDESGFTPLHYAAKVGTAKAAKFLIDQGADVSDGKATMITPLQTAARYGHVDMVNLLIEFGADPSLHTRQLGSTPLIAAAGHGEYKVVKILLQHPSVDVDAQDKKGRTALFFVSTQGRLAMIKVLLEAGADINHHTKAGETPLSGARRYKKGRAVKILEEHGATL